MKHLLQRSLLALLSLIVAAPMLFASVAYAADAPPPPPKIDSGDTAWMLTSTALVLLMTIPGLALFYAGMVNTTVGRGDNNSTGAGIVGFGLNLMGGDLTVLALSHIGAESSDKVVRGANKYMRYLNDIAVTWKVNEKLTLVTEANYIKDDFAKADGWGVAQYVSYALSDTLTLNGRAEVWRDGKNFFVAAFPGNLDFVNAQLGNPVPSIITAAKATTYGEFTIGVAYKPTLPAPISGLLIRPELRYDSALSGGKPFNGGKNNGAFTIASDFVLTF